jgi:hypothetical protein
MNRIYQGRVSGVALLHGKNGQPTPLSDHEAGQYVPQTVLLVNEKAASSNSSAGFIEVMTWHPCQTSLVARLAG